VLELRNDLGLRLMARPVAAPTLSRGKRMHTLHRHTSAFLSALCVVAIGLGAVAQEQTASQFYMAYRAAFAKAAKIDDLLSFMSKATRKQIESTPAAERPKMFEMVKAMNTFTGVKVVKEAKSADGVTLTLEATDSDKAKATGTVEIVREDGAWKVGRERWSSS
jgi:hypothetical protein